MDVKALAKSKRSHTQHHNKKGHHSHKVKAPSPSSSSSPASNDSAKHPSGTQQLNDDKKPRRSRFQGSSTLPNNWDRYEEEEELESGSEIASKNVDVALPKSKGADFRHLVAEAQSYAETSLEGFLSLDDLLPGEFGEGLCSMLVVRGEGIVSWVGDDNFVVEDRTSGNPEASFMSLNLHALAESLDKVDLSKRLFIESDLLPSELCVEELAVDVNEEHQELEAKEHSELANRMSKELSSDDFAAEDQFTSSSSSSRIHAGSTFALSNNSLVPVINAKVEFQQVGNSGKNKAFILNSEAMRGRDTTFEAVTAEEELDMLLDSLSETKILHSPGFKSNTTFLVSLGVSSVFPPQISKKDPAPSQTAIISASLDDALDDLLDETSSLMNPNVFVRPQEEKPIHHSIPSSSHSGSKSKVVVATAIAYMRHVYTRKSMAEYDPRLLAPTCLYLASKAEESTVQARLLVFYIKKLYADEKYRYEIKDILQMEMKILEALNYYLVVYHPFRSLSPQVSDKIMVDHFLHRFLQDAGLNDLNMTQLTCIEGVQVCKEVTALPSNLSFCNPRKW